MKALVFNYSVLNTFTLIFTVTGLALLLFEGMIRLLMLIKARRDKCSGASDRHPQLPFRDAYDDLEEAYRMPPAKTAAMEYNTYLGFLPKPSSAQDGYSINRYHFRYKEDFEAEKEKNELRIFITGGSKAWGAGVTQEKLYTQIMESRFRSQCHETKIRVICAAVNAYCSVQERIMLENLVLPLSPDYVIMFSGRNDCYFGYAGYDTRLNQDFFNYRKLIHRDERENEKPKYEEYGLKLHYALDRLLYRKPLDSNSLLVPKSVPAEQVVQILLNNVQIASDLARRYEFKLIFYLEPSIFTTTKILSDWEQSVMARGEQKFKGFPAYNRKVYDMLRSLLPRDGEANNYLFINGDEAISREERSIFTDNVHFGDRGYRLIADHMFDELQKLISQS